MKSMLRFNGQELVVEDAIPADDAFNEAVIDELNRVFPGAFHIAMEPLKNFRDPEHTDQIFVGVVTGHLETEVPMVVLVKYSKDDTPFRAPAFLSFRK